MAYWLFKSEPDVFSFADLMAEPDRSTGWDGVRNYQARNLLRDTIAVGDLVLFYHSNAEPPAIAGVAEVVEPGHPDPTAFDPASDHFDPKSDPANPTWYQVRIRGVQALPAPLGLPELKALPGLDGLELLRKGSRLSVQPVSEAHWQLILAHAARTPGAPPTTPVANRPAPAPAPARPKAVSRPTTKRAGAKPAAMQPASKPRPAQAAKPKTGRVQAPAAEAKASRKVAPPTKAGPGAGATPTPTPRATPPSKPKSRPGR